MSARRAVAATVVVLLALVGVSVALHPGVTSAAWNDPVVATGTVTSGSWAPTVTNECEIRNAAGIKVAGTTCVATAPQPQWGNEYDRYAYFYPHIQLSREIQSGEYVWFSVTVPTSNAPAFWSWANAGIDSLNFGANGGGVVSRCADLPVIVGKMMSNWGTSYDLYIKVSYARGSSPLCVTP
ncbi:SipW-dependent-type signal peptide-containing protein [Cellulomonas sp. HZM]|uniref:SipW-dependent-type signal peptide-containing protein n=1 Tax=Cellulomonas sp. HZM TaxID=1454010 RepID=UPI000493065D|nr:SipW-dependent-type signal peptide-containing protein [Cellulomonas sp. HZM]